MDKCGYDFVVMVKGMKSFINEEIKKVKGTFEDKRECSIRRYQVNVCLNIWGVIWGDDGSDLAYF